MPARSPAARGLTFAALGLAALALLALELLVGPAALSPGEVLRALAGGGGDGAGIVLMFRLPKALAALFSGAALCLAGLLTQTLFRNPLAGPDVLGVNSGAGLAVALLVALGGQGASSSFVDLGGLGAQAALALGAAGGAALTLLAALAAARRVRSATTVLIIGLVVGYLAGAAVGALLSFAAPAKLKAYFSWSQGSFAALGPDALPLFCGILAIAIGAAFLLPRVLDALLLGEDYARSAGISRAKARTAVIALAALLSGTVTAFCGPVGFIGVAMPHAARALVRDARHSTLVPACALVGAVTAMGADLLSQAPGGGAVLPLNAVTALIGAPIVLALVLSRRGGNG